MQQKGPSAGLFIHGRPTNTDSFKQSSLIWLSRRRTVQDFRLGQGKLLFVDRSRLMELLQFFQLVSDIHRPCNLPSGFSNLICPRINLRFSFITHADHGDQPRRSYQCHGIVCEPMACCYHVRARFPFSSSSVCFSRPFERIQSVRMGPLDRTGPANPYEPPRTQNDLAPTAIYPTEGIDLSKEN